MPTAVFSIDVKGLIRSFNQKACELWGLTPTILDPDTRYCASYKIFLPDGASLPHDQTPMVAAVRDGTPCKNAEVVILRPDGTRVTVIVNIAPIRDETGHIVGAINAFSDGSELVAVRKRLESQQRELEKAVATRDVFLSICSHELKTPLTSLKFQSDMAKRKLAQRDDSVFNRENVLKMIHQNDRQADRLGRLVDDMLDLTRIQSGKLTMNLEPAELGRLVRSVVANCNDHFGGLQGQITFNSCEEAVGHFDSFRIEQVITNLVSNSIRYGANKPIVIDIEKLESTVNIHFHDQGIGIAEHDQGRVFDRFERAVSATNISGLGLGLFVSRQIVEAHGGRISLKSKVGQGSTFTVELPLAAAAMPRALPLRLQSVPHYA